MDKQELILELRLLLGNYLKEQGLDLVDLIHRYEGRSLSLRILTDKPEGGISVGECAKLNRDICIILDEKEILKEGYILEVSSPGLDRPLVKKEDFLRCRNKEVRFFLNEPINEKMELQGKISKVDDDAVYIAIQGEVFEVPLVRIIKAKQIVI
jgi:ribosome maturation factor RimP